MPNRCALACTPLHLDWAAILALATDGSHVALENLHIKALFEQAHREHLSWGVCVNGPNWC